ncbi:MAG: M23 family metallopeptidase [Oscillospiraceae bacterium]|jgi:murein DD-endopeptidase MepM/ murein hydrolase activator NlpD|nr:M23 family metallopeptidase [Oscillospiraceae bacterium]
MQEYDRELSLAESENRFADIRALREQRRGGKEEACSAREEDAFAAGERPKGSFARVALTQIIVCALLLGGVFLSQKAAPNTYRQLRSAYQSMMRTDLSVKEVWAAVKGAFSSLKDEIYVMAPAQSGGEAAPGETQTQPAAQESGAASTAAAPVIGGGKDIPAEGNVTMDLAAKKCTLSPVLTTVAPLRPLADGRLTSAFGLRIHPITGKQSFHTGMDIAAPLGTPITAAFYGKVLQAATDADYGNFILMEHQGGLRTLYAHCSKLLAEEGMVLRAGETIALVGSTGVSNGPHLHFEVRIGELRCDPQPLFGGNGYPPKETAA